MTVAATQLGLYNNALKEIGEPQLASLTENRQARHALDSVYSTVIAECLEAGDWNHAIREIKAVADTGVTENFGMTESIGKPTDWVRTVAVCSDPDFASPLTDTEYQDVNGYWASYSTPIYVRYVSDSGDYGLDLTKWPRSFAHYVELCLADRVCLELTSNSSMKERLSEVYVPRAKRTALNKDTRNEGEKFRRRSSWNDARGGGYSRRDRGNRSSFTG